jgi:hypothetical protein
LHFGVLRKLEPCGWPLLAVVQFAPQPTLNVSILHGVGLAAVSTPQNPLTLASGKQELHRLVALRADWRAGLSLIHGPSKRLPLRKNTKFQFGNQAAAVFNREGGFWK